ncbi:hypothetical protein F5Y13DRAFT_189484 [Hypoxylon sp. FL1857]|nr:hypothetical protein F5Y13DRAFT_189484 [Hypoxylon sp. FL1857]
MEATSIFLFDRDWDANVSLMDQALVLVMARLEDGIDLPDILLAAREGAVGLPKYTVAWLWYTALAVTAQIEGQIVIRETDKTPEQAFLED